MQERTNWGVLLTPEGQQEDIDAAMTGTESDRGPWRWRKWEPQW